MRKDLSAGQHVFVSGEAAGGLVEGALPLEPGKLHRRGTNDAPSYILLYPENVFDLGVADLGPDVPARHRLGQLGVNANTIAGAANAAVEQIAHVEPLPDLGRRQLLPL